MRNGQHILFQQDGVMVLGPSGNINAHSVYNNRLLCLVQPPVANYSTGTPTFAFSGLVALSLSTWHQRLGHLNQQAICWLVSLRLVEGPELQSGGRVLQIGSRAQMDKSQ